MKVYDCFPFFNELDLLEVRFHELYDTVHRFILIESPLTHSGQPKPLYYLENKERFKQFNDKVIHVVEDFHDTDPSPWAREMAQRNRLLSVVTALDDQDLLIVSDLDEITRASALPSIIQSLSTTPRLLYLHMRFYYYFMNYEFTHISWSRAYIAPYGLLQQQNLTQIRVEGATLPHIVKVLGRLTLVPRTSFSHEETRLMRLQEARTNTVGWHFSYVGGINAITEKFKAFAHQEFNNLHFCDPSLLQGKIANKESLTGGHLCTQVPIDETYPKFVRDNIETFKQKGLISL